MLSSSQTDVDDSVVINTPDPLALCKANHTEKNDSMNPGSLSEKIADKCQSQADDKTQALSHQRVRNAQQPVAQLPPEILTEIFAKCPSDTINPPDHRSFRHYDIKTYYTALYRLMAVCKTWANVIEETPPLWSYISSYCNPNLVPKILARSSQRQLTVWYSRVRLGTCLNTTCFADLVVKHFPRWHTVEFLFSSLESIYQFRKILESNAGQIASLALNSHINDLQAPGGPPPLQILGGKSEHLRKLSVDRVPISWDVNAFRFIHLRKLHLASLLAGSAPKFSQLIAIFQQCEELTNVDLDRIDCTLDIIFKEPVVTLKHVVHLSLFRLPASTAGPLLQSIKAMPSCSSLSIVFSSTMSVTPNVLPRCLGHLLPDLKRIMLSAPIEKVDQGLQVIFEDGMAFALPSSLLIDMPDLEDPRQMVSAVQWFSSSVMPSTKAIPTTIEIHPDIDNWQESAIISSLDRFHVVKLRAASIFDPDFLFESLCVPISTKGESARWLFPNLKEIYASQYEGGEYEWAVLQAVKGRYGLIWTQQKFPDLRLPVPFTLTMAGKPLSSGMVTELSGIMGAESLILKPDEDYEDLYGAQHYDSEDEEDEEDWDDEEDEDEDNDEDEEEEEELDED